MRLIKKDDCIKWTEIGYYSDYDDGAIIPFDKVREYTFDVESYNKFLYAAEFYEYKG